MKKVNCKRGDVLITINDIQDAALLYDELDKVSSYWADGTTIYAGMKFTVTGIRYKREFIEAVCEAGDRYRIDFDDVNNNMEQA